MYWYFKWMEKNKKYFQREVERLNFFRGFGSFQARREKGLNKTCHVFSNITRWRLYLLVWRCDALETPAVDGWGKG